MECTPIDRMALISAKTGKRTKLLDTKQGKPSCNAIVAKVLTFFV